MTINATPVHACQVNGSRNQTAASITVNARLNLSIGATHDAGAICSARKYASHDMAVATPDSARKTSDRRDKAGRARCSPSPNTIAHANTRTTTVRIAVASVEGTPSTPSFARIAVAAAATADMSAYASQDMRMTSSKALVE